MKKHYLTQPDDPCEQRFPDEVIEEINDELEDYLESMADEKRLND